MLTLLRKELRTLLITPTLYLCLILFLFLSTYLHFVVGNYLTGQSASLAQTFFRWHPWLYAFFAPALAMRLWSEEHRQSTFEFLITLGHRPWKITVAKFLATLLILLLALALTFPVAVTAFWLGNPDSGTVMASYLGSALVAALFSALATAAASLTRNQFIAFILGSVLATLTFSVGSAAAQDSLYRTFPSLSAMISFLATLSPADHFTSFQIGLVPLATLLLFPALIALFLAVAVFSPSFPQRGRKRVLLLGGAAVFGLVLALSITRLPHFDATSSARHSLAASTAEFLQSLENPVSLRLFATQKNHQLSHRLRNHRTRVERLLNQLADSSQGKITLQFLDPTAGSEASAAATFEQLTPLHFTKDTTSYLGLVAQAVEKRDTIPLLAPDRAHLLEFDLIKLVSQVSADHKPTISMVSSLPVLGGTSRDGSSLPPWAFTKELAPSFNLRDDHQNPDRIADSDLLLVIHPADTPKPLEEAVTEAVKSGKPTILLLDPHCIALSFLYPEADYSPVASSNLPGLLKDLGVTFHDQKVVADLAYKSEINRGFGNETLHTILELPAAALSQSSPLTQPLSSLGFAFAGYFDFSDTASDFNAISLVTSSRNSTTVAATSTINLTREGNQSLLNSFSPDDTAKTLGLLLEKPTQKVILFADADFIFDTFAATSQQLSESETAITPLNGNLALLANSIDYLLQRPALAQARAKGTKTTRFSGLQHLKNEILARTQTERAQAEREITTLRNKKAQASEQSAEDTDVTALLKNRQSQQALDLQIEALDHKITALNETTANDTAALLSRIQLANLVAVPLLIFILALVILIHRHRSTQ